MTAMPVLSIDIGGSKLMTAVGEIRNDPGKSLLWLPLRKTRRAFVPGATSDDVLRAIRETLTELSVVPHDFQLIGLNVPGLADPQNGIWVYAPFSGIGNFPIAKILGDEWHVPVFLENDVNACALAEKYFGACRNIRHFLWVTISNGIGGGLVLNGEIFSGSSGNAGEIGHVCVEENEADAIRCGCGKCGCLEAQAAGPGISKHYQKLTGRVCTAVEIADFFRAGDANAIAVYEKTGFYLGKAIAAAANLLNPDKVILGGGVSGAFDLFFPALKRTFDQQVFRAANRNVSIERTALGEDAALAGAAAVAYHATTHPAKRG